MMCRALRKLLLSDDALHRIFGAWVSVEVRPLRWLRLGFQPLKPPMGWGANIVVGPVSFMALVPPTPTEMAVHIQKKMMG